MGLGLHGKTALILGGGTGVGRVVALTLAQKGAKVAVADSNKESLEQTVKEIREGGGQALPFLWDLEDASSFDNHVSTLEYQFGQIDILFNNIGRSAASSASAKDSTQWSKFILFMVSSIITITDWVLPSIKEKKWARIIRCASFGLIHPIPNSGVLSALRESIIKRNIMRLQSVPLRQSALNVSNLIGSLSRMRADS